MKKGFSTITEGLAKIAVPEKSLKSKRSISKALPVFYNPSMKLNRDITIAVLNALPNNKMQIGLPLAGSGVRAVRLLIELSKGKIKTIEINDKSSTAVKLIKKNIELNENNLICGDIEVAQQDAGVFLLEGHGYDYIDIDPFGSPVPFLDAAIVRISRGGILAVTATDTAALAGNSVKACLRKYNSKPLKNELMHELGVRILIKKTQEIGALHEKALIPIFSYFKDHYYRIFFRCEKGKQKADEILKQHKFLLYNTRTLDFKISKHNTEKGFNEYAGPLFAGELWDKKLLKKIKTNSEINDFLDIIKKESAYNAFFFDLHKLCKVYKLKIPTKESIFKQLKAVQTHFNLYGIKTNKTLKQVISAIKNKDI